MLWLCISLPRLPLEALHPRTLESPRVATQRIGNTRWVVCCNEPALQAGLQPGMNLNTAVAAVPRVQAFECSDSAQRSAMTRLAAWAYQFSSTVIITPAASSHHAGEPALWLEIGASLRLFGGLRTLIERLEAALEPLGYSHRLGVAATLEGALALARAGIRRAAATPAALRSRLAHLPLQFLQLDAWTSRQLMTLGVESTGELLKLPPADLAQRFGPEVCDYLQRLTGQRPDPRPVYRLPPNHQARFEFDSPVQHVDGILFVLRRLLHEFIGFLRARDTGTQRFTLTLQHREPPDTEIEVRLATPQRNFEQFMLLAREHLDRIQLRAGILGLELRASQFATPTAMNNDLLAGGAEHNESFNHTLDRLGARLGQQRVHGLRALADHRPEASWSSQHDSRQATALFFPPRPPWLLRRPEPLLPASLPNLLGPPERIAAGWWDDADIQRDYFLARTPQGALWWVFQDRRDGSWHLHGLWS